MLISSPEMEAWFSVTMSWIYSKLRASQSGVFFRLMKNFAMALLTCIFALGGAAIGSITGAIKGHTTETGLSRGFVIGAITGAITAIQLMELIANGEPFSKVALMRSLVNGKIFMEWVTPALLKAYQWQVSGTETRLIHSSDIFDVNTLDGLSQHAIQNLPIYQFYNAQTTTLCIKTCAICLQDMKDGEFSRLLSKCKHIFHVHCIDEWLALQGSCPICRKHV